MEEKCLCEPTEILIFPCSGGSNVGQIANQAGVKLTQDGMGRFFCLAGIGAHVSGMVESTKAGKMLVAIDGCPVACAKKTLEHAGFNIDEYVQVTDLEIEKNHDLNPLTPDVEKVAQYLSTQISKRRAVL
ncbi:MAG: zinc-binding protein [Deltaproteobacteria bacterium RBG_16_47_11]|nr:MAG: zinc-binding protein [Deltaproteobacteria bacterium RBG_16_47_11]